MFGVTCLAESDKYSTQVSYCNIHYFNFKSAKNFKYLIMLWILYVCSSAVLIVEIFLKSILFNYILQMSLRIIAEIHIYSHCTVLQLRMCTCLHK